MSVRPKFEVIIPTSTAAERRLVTAERVREMIGTTEADDPVVERVIDSVSAACARHCKLARSGTIPPTFGREYLRATFTAPLSARGWCHDLLLPWRVPIQTVTVMVDGSEVDPATYDLRDGATLHWPGTGWPFGSEIVVDYVAGWVLADEASAYDGDMDLPPDDLAMAVIDQVKMQFLNRKSDPALRSEAIPDVWSGAYNVAGGDSINKEGLLAPLESALADFCRVVVA